MGKIKHDKYIEMVEKLHCNYSGLIRWQVEGIVRDILADADVEVEPPPILPGVTQGTWILEEGFDRWNILAGTNVAAVWRNRGNDPGSPDMKEAEANAKLMAASKELAEVLYLLVGSIGNNNKVTDCSPKHAAIELLNKLGVDVDRFR